MYNALPKYGNILQYLLESSASHNERSASFKSNTERTSHFELPKTQNVSLLNYSLLF